MVLPAILPAARRPVHRLVRLPVRHSLALAGITAGTAPILIQIPAPQAGTIAGTVVALLAGAAMAFVTTAAIRIIITTTVKALSLRPI